MRFTKVKTSMLFAAIVAVFALGAVVVAGAAASPKAVSKTKSATLAGTSVWGTTLTIEGELAGTLATGTYAGTVTFGSWGWDYPECGPSCALVTGDITFSTKKGTFTAALQPGSIAIKEEIASHSWIWLTSGTYSERTPVDLRVVSGTRGYANKTGLLTLSYTSTWEHEWVWDGENLVYVNEIVDTGTLRLGPQRTGLR